MIKRVVGWVIRLSSAHRFAATWAVTLVVTLAATSFWLSLAIWGVAFFAFTMGNANGFDRGMRMGVEMTADHITKAQTMEEQIVGPQRYRKRLEKAQWN